MIIVNAQIKDLDEIEVIVNETREYFKSVSIPQWENGYPSRIDFEEDIKLSRLYVLKEEDSVIGMFSLVYPDHNYDYIEDGKWFDNSPYIAIHRMAIKKEYKGRGFASKAYDFVKENYDHIRIDTHKLNEAMNRSIQKNDFKYCGTIYVSDGSPRNAYEWSRKYPDVVSNFNFSNQITKQL